jgi:hypothetical protein
MEEKIETAPELLDVLHRRYMAIASDCNHLRLLRKSMKYSRAHNKRIDELETTMLGKRERFIEVLKNNIYLATGEKDERYLEAVKTIIANMEKYLLYAEKGVELDTVKIDNLKELIHGVSDN